MSEAGKIKGMRGGGKVIKNMRTILERLDDSLFGTKEIKTLIESSEVTARKYINVLGESDLVKVTYVREPSNNQKSIRISTKNIEITEEVLNSLQQRMLKKFVSKYHLKGEDFEELNNQTSPGITVHSSNESHWYREKKSNRNHASGASLSALSFAANY